MPLIDRPVCPFCHSSERTTLLSLPFDGPELRTFLQSYYDGRVDQSLLAGGSYTLDRCEQCGGMWQQSILDDAGMAALYGEWIPAEHSRKRRSNAALSLQYARHCARLLRLLPDAGSRLLLDYGMGWGDWCHMAQSFGFRVHGVELSEERIAHARTIGIPCSLPSDLPEGPFDFIYMEQVLEHLPDPRGTLERLTTKLKPGGYIHIGVPNGQKILPIAPDGSSVLRKGPGQPLEHINIFTPKALKTFLASFGCVPASQREGLLRVSNLVPDLCLSLARLLPSSVFPRGTSVLFQKTH